MPLTALSSLLSIHPGDCLGHGEFDIFSEYNRTRSMTITEFFIEYHIDQFYRIIFFVQELQARVSVNDDNYDGPLPYDLLPEEIQAIVYDDGRYREYLLERRSKELSHIGDSLRNSARPNLGSSARVQEEDLFSMMNLLCHDSASTSTTTATSSSTTTATISSTPNPRQELKKGSCRDNEYGKHFTKPLETSFPDNCCKNGDQKPGTSASTKSLSACLQNEFNYSLTNSTTDRGFFICSRMRLYDE